MAEKPRYAVARLDELESIPGPGSLTWRPVRARLGVRAFGTNAYTANAAGDDVVEPHTENPELAHEELYFVARGSARFTLDGERIEAGAGTYVFVRDPGVHRHAVALEAGTTVLSFGGPPVFTPSAWEWMFRAFAALDAGELEHAREAVAEGLALHPESPALHWALARLRVADGDHPGALAALRVAIGGEPELAAEARRDERLAGLRGDAEFERLTERG